MIQDIKLERVSLRCYKDPMVKEKRSELVGSMVTARAKTRLEEIAGDKDRSLSYVASALLMRGLAAFERDGKLSESEGASGTAGKTASVRMPRIAIGDDEEASKKKRGNG